MAISRSHHPRRQSPPSGDEVTGDRACHRAAAGSWRIAVAQGRGVSPTEGRGRSRLVQPLHHPFLPGCCWLGLELG
jgi:hypothetical protein